MMDVNGIDEAAIRRMAESGFGGVLLGGADTRNLLDRHDAAALADFATMVRAHGMMAGFAGAFEPPDVPRLRLLEADILAFASDAATFDVIRAQMPAEPQPQARAEPAATDDRIATRPSATDTRDGTDRVFVHDFVLPVHIGTYARERDKAQNVRFSVDVSVARPSHMPHDMRDVFSYDVITDSIRMIVAQGHVPLVETLAERVAAAVLAHPRAARVMVRVEKLDTGSGSVGVEIARERLDGP
jgi:FolB domain-containing protein